MTLLRTQDQTVQLSADDAAELVAVARRFGDEQAGRLALGLDDGNSDAIDTCWRGLCEIGLDRCLASDAHGGATLPTSILPTLAEAVAGGDGGIAMLMVLSNIALAALPDAFAETLGARESWVYVPATGARGVRQATPVLDVAGNMHGQIGFVLGGAGAEGFVVACRKQDTGEPVLAFVSAAAPGLTVHHLQDTLAFGGAPTASLAFHGAEATPCGDPSDVTCADALLHECVAGVARGIARRAHRLALAYAQERYQGGGPIINHGAVRDMLGRMVERELGFGAIGFGVGVSAGGDAASLARLQSTGLARKVAATDAAVLTTIDAVQVFGGIGYMHETGVEKLMRDAKYCQLYPRPNWVVRDELVGFG